MPKMDGITFLKKLMRQHPIPTVVCSTLVGGGTETALLALEAGAVELITKPTLGTREFLQESRDHLCDAVKAAAQAKLKPMVAAVRVSNPAAAAHPVARETRALSKAATHAMVRTTHRVVAVGASTGGTEALRTFLTAFPVDGPAIVIVQHMPEGFTATFARRLNDCVTIDVKEAADGDTVLPGRALIARGNQHMLLERSGARYHVRLNSNPPVSRHRPSVNALFDSVATVAGRNAIGVIMTGMGDDGATGLLAMRQAGATTFGQDQETCVVYGMPCEAFKLGGVQQELPLHKLSKAVLDAAFR
jgi:two-component system chemotaxis response regulator CheB